MKIVKFYLKPVALCTCLAMTAQSNAQNEKLPTDEDTPLGTCTKRLSNTGRYGTRCFFY